ncbi:Hsp70 family protein [Nocardioides speluncae]|uniref:Hsp70 family protein n=1 Tax=Nocardioides speluncae TaxID=2670337 RepID=UPI000D68F8EA|nr:Hsp70 family protein [Nocardioides speluncae]
MNLAVVVGCSAYEDPIPSLRFASDDARRIADTLQSTCGLDANAIVVLNEEDAAPRTRPTFTNVLRTLSRARLQGPPPNLDTLFFFFSGHGYHSMSDGHEYLLLGDSVGEDLEHTALSVQTVVARLQEWSPRHLVLLVDACREAVSDSKGRSPHEGPGVDVNALLPSGNITFSSCAPGQRSYEHQAVGSGIFTEALCEGLSDLGRCRTLHELNSYLQRRVPELCHLYGKPRQDPVARLEPAEVLALEIVSQAKRNQWRTSLSVGEERRPARVPTSTTPGLQPTLALDFGTCNTLAAVLDSKGEMHVVPGPDGRSHVPSVVNFDSDWDYVVGADAIELDRLRPAGTVWYPKRELGSPTQFTIHDKSLTAEFVCSLILRSVRRNAEEFIGAPIEAVVASYPASFSIAQSNALQQAMDLAGLKVMRFLPEPSATGYLGPDTGYEWALIIDLGGGTLDVSVYELGIDDDGFTLSEIKATQGDGRLGGIDYDEALEELLRRQVRQRLGTAELPPFVRNQVCREAVRAKHVLSTRDSCEVLVADVEAEGGDGDLLLRIDRASFEEITQPLNRRVADSIFAVVREALAYGAVLDEPSSDTLVVQALRGIKHVLLCGQGTRVPSLIKTVGSMTPATVISTFQNDAVVQGLAQQVGVLRGHRKDQLLLDVLQQGIGVLVERTDPKAAARMAYNDEANTEVLTIVAKGTTIPTKRTEIIDLLNHEAGRTYRIRVVEIRTPWAGLGTEPIGILEYQSGSKGELEITCEVDANSTILLTIGPPGGKGRTVVLNRANWPGYESILDQRLTGSLEEAGHADQDAE